MQDQEWDRELSRTISELAGVAGGVEDGGAYMPSAKDVVPDRAAASRVPKESDAVRARAGERASGVDKRAHSRYVVGGCCGRQRRRVGTGDRGDEPRPRPTTSLKPARRNREQTAAREGLRQLYVLSCEAMCTVQENDDRERAGARRPRDGGQHDSRTGNCNLDPLDSERLGSRRRVDSASDRRRRSAWLRGLLRARRKHREQDASDCEIRDQQRCHD